MTCTWLSFPFRSHIYLFIFWMKENVLLKKPKGTKDGGPCPKPKDEFSKFQRDKEWAALLASLLNISLASATKFSNFHCVG